MRLRDGLVIMGKAPADWPGDTCWRLAEICHAPSAPSAWPAGHLGWESANPCFGVASAPDARGPEVSPELPGAGTGGRALVSQEDALGVAWERKSSPGRARGRRWGWSPGY